MKRNAGIRWSTAAALSALLLAGCAAHVAPVTPRVYVPKTVGTRAPHLGCQSGGCAYIPAPSAEDVPHEDLVKAMAAVSAMPVGTESLALDTLLFHDGEVRDMLAGGEASALSPAWSMFLQKELSRRTAWFTMRVIDEQGRVRALLPETQMALGAKKHMEISDSDLNQDMNANGTVIRVGLKHLWYRM